MKLRILISEFMDAPAVASLAAAFDVHYDSTLVERRTELEERLGDADGLIVRNRTQVDAALLRHAGALRVVGRLGVGLDNIDTTACSARGVEVIPATGANALAVAEYVIAAMMLLLRTAYRSTAEVAAGKWPRATLGEGRELAGKTLGLVGFGGIGRATARLARGLGVQVIAYDTELPPAAAVWAEIGVIPVTMDQLLADSDVVSVHIPLVPATRNLFDAQRLARMKPDAILINTSRGGIVDEHALAAALRAERLGGAALDVYAIEPLPAGSPLEGVPNLLLTPHIAGVTRESNARVSTLIAQKVAAALSGGR